MMRVAIRVCVAVLAALLTVSAAEAGLLLDFGSTAYTGTDSPAHADGAVTGSSWNSFATDKTSGFVDEDGVAVAGLEVDFGVETAAGSKTVDYSLATKAASYSGSPTYALFNSDLGTDHVVRDSGSTEGVALAVKGLALGTYDVYLTGFRGDTGANAGKTYQTAWATGAADVTDWTTAPTAPRPNSTAAPAGNWVERDNYLKFTVTLDAAAPNLYVFDRCDSYIGVLNSMEIVEGSLPGTGDLVYVDYENTHGTSNVSINQYNANTGQHWQAVFGAGADDSNDRTSGDGLRMADSTVPNQGYFLAGIPSGADTVAFAWTDDGPAVDVSDLDTMSAVLNNASTDDRVRFALLIGDQWYASDDALGIDPAGVGFNNWSNAREVSLDVVADASAWRLLEVDPGTSLALGATASSGLAGGVDAFGLFMEIDGEGLVRLDDFTVTPEPASLVLLGLGAGGLAFRRRRR